MSRMLSVIAGTSLLALAGAANAAEPIVLDDMQMDGVSAGGSFSIYQSVNFSGTINPVVTANVAAANATAGASGPFTYTDAQTATYSQILHSSSSASTSISVAKLVPF